MDWRTHDVYVRKGVEWAETFTVHDDTRYVPVSEIVALAALLTTTDRLDGPVLAILPAEMIDDVRTRVRPSIPASVAQGFNPSSITAPTGWFWLYYIDPSGQIRPIRKGRVVTLP